MRCRRRAARSTFAAHDDILGFDDLCGLNLRDRPSARLWRIFSNQYFFPLLLLNQHHAAEVEALSGMRAGGCSAKGLWGPALRGLIRPRPRLQEAAASFAERSRQRGGGGATLGIHVRTNLADANEHKRAAVLRCVKARLAALGASRLFVATMSSSTRSILEHALGPKTAVLWWGDAVGVQGETPHQLDAAVIDLWLLGNMSSEVLVSRGSTYSYVAHGLSGRRATVYGVSHNSAASGGILSDCASIPTTEASFHLARRALQSKQCRRGISNASRASQLWNLSTFAY